MLHCCPHSERTLSTCFNFINATFCTFQTSRSCNKEISVFFKAEFFLSKWLISIRKISYSRSTKTPLYLLILYLLYLCIMLIYLPVTSILKFHCFKPMIVKCISFKPGQKSVSLNRNCSKLNHLYFIYKTLVRICFSPFSHLH